MKKNLCAAAVASVIASLPVLVHAQADNAVDAEAAAATATAAAAAVADGPIATVEIATHKTRSAVAMNKSDIQKILPGINPLKALQTLPGVSFQTADPWGNNEQNLSLFVHGFNAWGNNEQNLSLFVHGFN
ncbi:hypothetical protein AB4Z11_26655, partial [Pseudoduganella sp. RAF53_2]